MRLHQIIFLVVLSLLVIAPIDGQSPNGTISGIVVDSTGSAIVGAEILIANDATAVQYSGKTNEDGFYLVPNLPPGTYRLQVSRVGFKTLIKPEITLNVQDALAINFTLPIGAVSEIVTVTAGAPLVNTESAAVSTVIDRQFVESLPLNGRSFNALLQLSPGVVVAPANSFSQGQFSVAGQRTSANNFLVDGVSANFGVSPAFGIGSSGTGSAQAFSALGGTSSLVSVEALQEFRIETSSFAPEFGHSPGGQVILTTRSGTNDFHGGLYDYFRNDVLDANNWFANQAGKPRPAERHNDFGGFLGGPFLRDHTFFFVSYEGARLREPNTEVVTVPSEFARQSAPAAIAPFLNAFPQPDDRSAVSGVYTANFTGNFSNPSNLNVGSIRIDHAFNSRFSLFGRYNEAPSQTAARSDSLNEIDTTQVTTRTATISATMALTPQMSNALRGNYSLQTASFVATTDSFGGAVPLSPNVFAPNPLSLGSSLAFFGTFDTGAYGMGPSARNRATQLNFADDLSLNRGAHQLKFGADYRAIFLNVRPFQNSFTYVVLDLPDFIATGKALIAGETTHPSKFLTQETSFYGQDTWKITSRLALTYGLRWEISPAPSGRAQTTLASWQNVNDPAQLALAPFGTPLWSTSYVDLAPRVGVAYSLNSRGDFVLRAGVGIFYDLASDAVGDLAAFFPNDSAQCCISASLPVTNASPFLPVISTVPPITNTVRGYAPNLKLPRSYQWNVALEKSFEGRQVVSVTYAGQAGRTLLRQEGIAHPNANFTGNFLLTQDDSHSNYNALQVQYRRPLSSWLQALLNYTWAHSLDNASNDVLEAISNTVISGARDYASANFDVRHSLSGAMRFEIPAAGAKGLIASITKDWSTEAVAIARTGFPYNAVVLTQTIGGAHPRPNLVASQAVYIPDPTAGGGKSLNPAAFTRPTAGTQGTEGRNDIPGFGLTQVDFSVARKFSLTERVRLQFRTDAFNVLNHPNFTNPQAFIGLGPSFLKSPSMLNQGLGGLNSIFQEGGPRSLQLSLKLTF